MQTYIKENQGIKSDGWQRVDDTWTYASASTITVPSGAASLYQKGDRIKWTQTTVKYGVIVAVADTLLTIAVNTDYVVTNAAISAVYYSHQANPLGYPHHFSFTSTIGGFTTGTTVLQYEITGAMMTIFFTNGFGGTSNATGFTFTIPVAARETSNGAALVYGQDNSSLLSTPCNIETQTSTTINVYKTFYNGAWTNTGTKNIWGRFSLSI